MSKTVGIRELRHDLSRYLRRVKGGERLVVTDRNRPVAVLAPLPEDEDPYERLIAEGKLTPATRRLRDLGPPIDLGGDLYGASKALEEVSQEWWEDESGG
ncbi:MAG: type II toxin-antitoxin system Phd/YefM family antitoxin [Thermoleophilaceae bacterium]|jgi:prevent-host-death family protein|nr:type II toxin-antitoxin system Phd/YefM family antitoxin [Thermoleophilaceae bacterium]